MASKATPTTASEKDYKFVDDLSEEYTCQVCMKLLNEPQLTDCCGQHFCRACLDCWFQQTGKKQCPHCRSETFAHILYLPLKRKINELKVYCSNKEKGCGLIMKLEELDKHLSTDNPNGCGYVTVKCPNKGCDESCLQKDLANHVSNNCTQREVKCEYCGEVGTYQCITDEGIFGHLSNCQEYPMDCPRKCNTIRDLKRKDLKAHKEVCPLEPVDCPFRQAGCKEEPVRKDLDSHIQTNIQQHLLATNSTLIILKSTLASVASELNTIKDTVKDRSVAESLERITTTLNQVSPQLQKEGDKIEFQFSSSLNNWKSPVFNVNDSRMYMYMALNAPDSSRGDSHSLSVQLVNGELDGKYQINIGFSIAIFTDTRHNLTAFTTYLCTKCNKLFVQGSSADSKQLAKYTLPLHLIRKMNATCILTLTLEEHNCTHLQMYDLNW